MRPQETLSTVFAQLLEVPLNGVVEAELVGSGYHTPSGDLDVRSVIVVPCAVTVVVVVVVIALSALALAAGLRVRVGVA